MQKPNFPAGGGSSSKNARKTLSAQHPSSSNVGHGRVPDGGPPWRDKEPSATSSAGQVTSWRWQRIVLLTGIRHADRDQGPRPDRARRASIAGVRHDITSLDDEVRSLDATRSASRSRQSTPTSSSRQRTWETHRRRPTSWSADRGSKTPFTSCFRKTVTVGDKLREAVVKLHGRRSPTPTISRSATSTLSALSSTSSIP